jgi:hypothetical protein
MGPAMNIGHHIWTADATWVATYSILATLFVLAWACVPA